MSRERAWQQHFMKKMLPFSCWDWKKKKMERDNNLPLHILEAEIYSFEHIQIDCSLMFKESCFKGKYPCKLNWFELVMTAVILLIFGVWLCCQTEVWVPIKNSESSINRTPSMKVLLTEQELEWQPWKVHHGYPRGFTENWNRMFAAEVTGKSDWPQAAWMCLINWLNCEDLGAWRRLLSKLNALKLKDACISAQGTAVI